MRLDSREYSFKEELLHSLTHGTGALLSVFGLLLLLTKLSSADAFSKIGATTYGAALVLVYTASCLFHAAPHGSIMKKRLEKLDHSAIYLLILGTYIPAFTQITSGSFGYAVLIFVSACALLGIILSCISVERFSKICFALYIISGLAIASQAPLIAREAGQGAALLLILGALFYLLGTRFYKLRNIPYMHLFWHIFVVCGSAVHYIMIYSFFYS